MTKTAKKVRIKYADEIEAAWFTLKPFINLLDCSSRFEDQVVRMNSNATLEHLFNRDTVIECYHPELGKYRYDISDNGKRIRPFHFAKRHLYAHFCEEQKHYYNSRLNACPTTGYHGYDDAFKKLPFHKEFLIEGKVKKYEQHLVILVGVDIDCHQGQTDARDLLDFVLEDFPSAYWEPSKRGYHIYLKIICPANHKSNRFRTLEYMKRVFRQFFNHLQSFKNTLCLRSELDKPCGLPMVLKYDREKKRLTVKRSQTISIPMFGSDGSSLPSLEKITQFYYSPDVFFESIEEKTKNYTTQHKQRLIFLHEEDDWINEDVTIDSTLFEENKEETEKNTNNNSIEDILIHKYQEETIDNIKKMSVNDYPKLAKVIENERNEPNTHLKLLKIGHAYMRENVVRNTEELYQGLLPFDLWRKDKKKEDVLRILRQVVEFRKDTPESLGFNYQGFDSVKDQVIRDLKTIISWKNVDLTYKKLKTRRSKISVEKVAAVYFAIRKSLQGNQQWDNSCNATPFGYRSGQKAIEEILGKKVSKNEIGAILKILQDLDILWKLGGYTPGLAGQKYGCRRHLGGLLKKWKAEASEIRRKKQFSEPKPPAQRVPA